MKKKQVRQGANDGSDKPYNATRARDERRAKAKLAFIAAFGELGTVFHAAQKVGVTRQTHYEWLREDREYASAFEDARADRADLLFAEANRRAADGVLEPVFWQGVAVGAIRKYSDTLMLAQLKAAMPERYRERYDMNFSKAKDGDLTAEVVAELKAAGLTLGALAAAASPESAGEESDDDSDTSKAN